MIVTIDGPAGSGKSTVARRLAERLRFRFLDTGAMYRAVAFACRKRGVALDDLDAVAQTAQDIAILLKNQWVWVDGEDVTSHIRTGEVSQSASVVAMNPRVREVLVHDQRKFAEGTNVVTEGRDQGTVVFPAAERKYFLTATLAERAARRQKELESRGTVLTIDQVLEDLKERDQRDTARDAAPLKAAPDAEIIDTTGMSIDEVVSQLAEDVCAAEPTNG